MALNPSETLTDKPSGGRPSESRSEQAPEGRFRTAARREHSSSCRAHSGPGSISFGLVNVPVRMYCAIARAQAPLPLRPREGRRAGSATRRSARRRASPVPDDEIVKAFEFEKGEYVYMTDEDFEAARRRRLQARSTSATSSRTTRSTRSTSSAPTTSGPQEGAEKVYALLVRAMEDSGLAAIAKYVMRDRQNLGCLRVRDGVITLERMYFADEIRPADELEPERRKVGRTELEMAAAADRLLSRASSSPRSTRTPTATRSARSSGPSARARRSTPTPAPSEERAAPT